jgi:predicted amidophosphoribosyltransferase
MTCRSCGAEIADKALVCYRCGAPTADAKYKPPPRRARSSPILMLRVLIVGLVASIAIYAIRFASGDATNAARWFIVLFAAAIIAFRLVSRRRRA